MPFKSAGPNDQRRRILKAMVHVIAKLFVAILRKLLTKEVPAVGNRVQCPILLKG